MAWREAGKERHVKCTATGVQVPSPALLNSLHCILMLLRFVPALSFSPRW